mgnify:CR=1 FL=1
MKKKSKIDIILPNFNSSKYIKSTLKSIINQTYKKWNLVIVDDASDEKTKKILKRYSKNKKIKIYWLKENQGAGYCRNFALKKTNSEYVAFIDSDDIWEKNKLDNQLKFMKKNNYQFTYTNYKTFGKKSVYIYPPQSFNYYRFIRNTSICTSTILIKRSIIKGAKFTNTKICEDFYFKCFILKNNQAFCLNNFLTKYRIRKNSLQSNNLRNLYWIWKINKDYNKLNIIENFFSLFYISINSIKKYGLKNL